MRPTFSTRFSRASRSLRPKRSGLASFRRDCVEQRARRGGLLLAVDEVRPRHPLRLDDLVQEFAQVLRQNDILDACDAIDSEVKSFVSARSAGSRPRRSEGSTIEDMRTVLRPRLRRRSPEGRRHRVLGFRLRACPVSTREQSISALALPASGVREK